MEKNVYFDLDAMRNVDIQCVSRENIVDIRDTNVKSDMPLLERALDYISQIKNPYFFRCGKITVKIEHSETDITLEDCMEGYFRSAQYPDL